MAFVVNLPRVRAALVRLDALALAHPEAFDGRGVAAWTDTLEADGAKTMNEPTIQTGVRLPVSLMERVDAYGQRLNAELPGAAFSRTDAIRMLLVRGLDAIGEADESRKMTGKR